MHPTNITIQKGTKLRLSISASAYPAIGVNTGFGDDKLSSFYQSQNHYFEFQAE